MKMKRKSYEKILFLYNNNGSNTAVTKVKYPPKNGGTEKSDNNKLYARKAGNIAKNTTIEIILSTLSIQIQYI